MAIAGALYVQAPTHKDLPFGLLSVAQVHPASDPHVLVGAEWEVDACGIAGVAAQPCGPGGTAEVQTISITGTPTGGSYRLCYLDQCTNAITYNSNAAAVQTRIIDDLTFFDTGDVVITGTYPNFTATFGNEWVGSNVAQFTKISNLTGGTSPNVVIATTTQGVGATKASSTYATTATAYPVTVFTNFECRAIGEWQRAQARAMNALNSGESRALEKAFWQTTLDATGTTDLTPATTTIPEQGLATLEAWTGDNYGYVPTFHMPRNLASILATRAAIHQQANHLETKLGSLVAAGAGYSVDTGPNASAPVAGETWMYATGAVQVWRGNAITGEPHLAKTAGEYDNTIKTLVERPYVIGHECILAAIRVKDA